MPASINGIFLYYLPTPYCWQKHFQYCYFNFLLFLCQHRLMSCFNPTSPGFPLTVLLYMLVFLRAANSSIYSPNHVLFMKDHIEEKVLECDFLFLISELSLPIHAFVSFVGYFAV